jgi:hypothetical protein
VTEKKPREIERLTEDDIKDLVRGLVAGRFFVGSELNDDSHMIDMVFLPLLFMDVDWENVGNIIEDISKASSSAINGYPIFMSCRIIHKDDWAVVVERTIKARKALDAAVEGA